MILYVRVQGIFQKLTEAYVRLREYNCLFYADFDPKLKVKKNGLRRPVKFHEIEALHNQGIPRGVQPMASDLLSEFHVPL